ncbi:MAG: hypothetical protein ACE5H5_00625 [Nitrospinota bacterium]
MRLPVQRKEPTVTCARLPVLVLCVLAAGLWVRPVAAQDQSVRLLPEPLDRPASTSSLAHTFTSTFTTRLSRHMEQAFLERYHLTSLSSAYLFQLEVDDAEAVPNLYYAEPVRDAVLDALGHSLREIELYRRAEEAFYRLKNAARVSVVKQGSSFHFYGPSLNPTDEPSQSFDMKATAKLVADELFFTVDAGSLETRLVVDLLNTDEGSFTIVKHLTGHWHIGLNNSWQEGQFETVGQLDYRF